MDSWNFPDLATPSTTSPLPASDPTYALFLEGLKASYGTVDETSHMTGDSLNDDVDEYVDGASPASDDDDDDDDDDDGADSSSVSSGTAGGTLGDGDTREVDTLGSPIPRANPSKARQSSVGLELSDLLSEDIQFNLEPHTMLMPSATNPGAGESPPPGPSPAVNFELPALADGARESASKGGSTVLRPYTNISGSDAPKAVTTRQMTMFGNLMQSYHQLLVASAAVCVRKALTSDGSDAQEPSRDAARASEDDVRKMCLSVAEDSANKLQALSDWRSNAVRNSLKYKTRGAERLTPVGVPREKRREEESDSGETRESRITRATFSKLVEDEHERTPEADNDQSHDNALSNSMGVSNLARNKDGRMTAFHIPGVTKTKNMLRLLDASVDAKTARIIEGSALDRPSDGSAVESLLAVCGVTANKDCLPVMGGEKEKMLELFSEGRERVDTRRFTKAEDQLILKAVDCLGERDFALISSQYLPNRSQAALNHRHSVLVKKYCDARVKRGGEKVQMVVPPAHDPNYNAANDRWKLVWDQELWFVVKNNGRSYAKIAGDTFSGVKDRQQLRKRYIALERKFKNVLAKDEDMYLDSCAAIKPHERKKKASRPVSSSSVTTTTAVTRKSLPPPASRPPHPPAPSVPLPPRAAVFQAPAPVPAPVPAPAPATVQQQQQQPLGSVMATMIQMLSNPAVATQMITTLLQMQQQQQHVAPNSQQYQQLMPPPQIPQKIAAPAPTVLPPVPTMLLPAAVKKPTARKTKPKKKAKASTAAKGKKAKASKKGTETETVIASGYSFGDGEITMGMSFGLGLEEENSFMGDLKPPTAASVVNINLFDSGSGGSPMRPHVMAAGALSGMPPPASPYKCVYSDELGLTSLRGLASPGLGIAFSPTASQQANLVAGISDESKFVMRAKPTKEASVGSGGSVGGSVNSGGKRSLFSSVISGDDLGGSRRKKKK